MMIFSETVKLIRISLQQPDQWSDDRQGKLACLYRDACMEINSGSLHVAPEDIPEIDEHLAWAEIAVKHGCPYPPRPMPPAQTAVLAELPPEAALCSNSGELERLYRNKVRNLSLKERITFLRKMANQGIEWAKSDIAALMPEWGNFLRKYSEEAYREESLARLNAAAAEISREEIRFKQEDKLLALITERCGQLLTAEKIKIAEKLLQLMEETGGSNDECFQHFTEGWQQEFANGSWNTKDGFPQKRYLALVNRFENAAAVARRQEFLSRAEGQLRALTAADAPVDSGSLENVRELCREIVSAGGVIDADLQEAADKFFSKAEYRAKALRRKVFIGFSALLCLVVLTGCYLVYNWRIEQNFRKDAARIRILQNNGEIVPAAEALRRLNHVWPDRGNDPLVRELASLQREMEENEQARCSAFADASDEIEGMRRKGFPDSTAACKVLERLAENAVTDDELAYCNGILDEILAAGEKRDKEIQEKFLADIAVWRDKVSAAAADDSLSNYQKIVMVSTLRKEFGQWILEAGLDESATKRAGELIAEMDVMTAELNRRSAVENQLAILETEILQADRSPEDFLLALERILPELEKLDAEWAALLADTAGNISAATGIAALGTVPAVASLPEVADALPVDNFWKEVVNQVIGLENELTLENREIKALAAWHDPCENLFSVQFEAADGRIYEYFLVPGTEVRYDNVTGGSEFTCFGSDGMEKICRFRAVDDNGRSDFWFEHADRLEIRLKDMIFVPPQQHLQTMCGELDRVWQAENTPAVKAALAEWMGRAAADKNINPVLLGRRFMQYRNFLCPEIPEMAAYMPAVNAFAAWTADNEAALYDLPCEDFRTGKTAAGAVDWNGIAAFWHKAAAVDRRKEILAWDRGAVDMRWQLVACEFPVYSGSMDRVVFPGPVNEQDVWRMIFKDGKITACSYAGRWGGSTLLETPLPEAVPQGSAVFLFAGNGMERAEKMREKLLQQNGECPEGAKTVSLWRNIP